MRKPKSSSCPQKFASDVVQASGKAVPNLIFCPIDFTLKPKQVTINQGGSKSYFCGSLGSFFFFFFEAFGFRAGAALGFIVLLLRLGESFPIYGSGDGRLKVLLACNE